MSPSRDSSQLLEKLTLAQKVSLISGSGPWTTKGEPTIGLASITMSDGPAGVRGDRWVGATSVNIPSATALAATWDPELIQKVGRLLASEARLKDVDVILAPTVNLQRTPFGGRHFECWSEDPLLTGIMAAALVRGIQSEGVAACAKHFVANESETERMAYDVRVGERALRELYLAPFEHLVSEGVWTVMAAYNGVNGHTMTENPLLQTVLREEWEFDGLVVSDWTAVRSTEEAARAGTDLAMPGPERLWGEPLLTAIQEGRVPEDVIDDKLERLFRLAGRVGKLNPNGKSPDPMTSLPEAAEITRETASASFVLVRNESILPLDPAQIATVAVLGPNAAVARTLGGGSAYVDPPYAISPLEGIRAALAGSASVIHAPGPSMGGDPAVVDRRLGIDPFTQQPGIAVRILDARDRELQRRHIPTAKLFSFGDFGPGVDPRAVAAIEMLAEVAVPVAGEYLVGFGGIGHYSLKLDGEIVLEKELSPDLGVDHLEQALRPELATTPLQLEPEQSARLTLRHELGETSGPTVLQLYLEATPENPAFALKHAVEAAKVADVAVVVVGTNDVVESEGYDRTSLALPGHQDDLIRSIAAVNPSTVVVVNSGAPVLMPWENEVAAILLTWFPGQEFGNALSDVLLGAAEPAGRMPSTWWRDREGLPSVRPTNGKLEYTERGIGYRRSDAEDQILVPFGHGLGYTDWAYDALVVDLVEGGEAVASVTLRNTGDRPGSEVIQLYLSRDDTKIERPQYALAGFAKVKLDPEESATTTIRIPRRSFEHWDQAAGSWQVEPGTWRISAGRSVTDHRLSRELTTH